MKKKMTVVLSLLGILVLVSGGVTYFVLDQKKETAQSSVFVAEEKQTKTSLSTQGSSEKKETSDSSDEKQTKASQKPKLSKDSKKEKEVQDFNASVLSQDYYLEKIENGRLSYEKATEAGLKLLEKQAGDNNLSHYQVLYEGKMIAVLTGNQEGTDT